MSAVKELKEGYYAENNIRYVFIDGFACKEIGRCFTILQQQLSIPAYFGKNLDALEEVLEDLEWVKEEKIKIVISNSASLLEDDSPKKNSFLDVLHSSANDKIEIIYLADASTV